MVLTTHPVNRNKMVSRHGFRELTGEVYRTDDFVNQIQGPKEKIRLMGCYYSKGTGIFQPNNISLNSINAILLFKGFILPN